MIVLGADEPEPGVFNIVGIKKPDKVLDDFWNADFPKTRYLHGL